MNRIQFVKTPKNKFNYNSHDFMRPGQNTEYFSIFFIQKQKCAPNRGMKSRETKILNIKNVPKIKCRQTKMWL